MHHLSDDRPGPDDRHLDHQVVEALGPHARQRRHLGAALDLEDADRVGALEHGVDRGIVGRQVRQVDLDALVRAHQRDGLLERRQHAEAEQVDLDEAQIGAVVLVPLDDGAARHRGGLERHDVVEPAGGDHHAAGVLAEMPRQPLQLLHQLDQQRDARRRRDRRRRCAAAPPARRGGRDQPCARSSFASRSTCCERQPERLAHLAHGAARAVADDGRRHARRRARRSGGRRTG